MSELDDALAQAREQVEKRAAQARSNEAKLAEAQQRVRLLATDFVARAEAAGVPVVPYFRVREGQARVGMLRNKLMNVWIPERIGGGWILQEHEEQNRGEGGAAGILISSRCEVLVWTRATIYDSIKGPDSIKGEPIVERHYTDGRQSRSEYAPSPESLAPLLAAFLLKHTL